MTYPIAAASFVATEIKRAVASCTSFMTFRSAIASSVIDKFESRYERLPLLRIDLKPILVPVQNELFDTEIDGLVGE